MTISGRFVGYSSSIYAYDPILLPKTILEFSTIAILFLSLRLLSLLLVLSFLFDHYYYTLLWFKHMIIIWHSFYQRTFWFRAFQIDPRHKTSSPACRSGLSWLALGVKPCPAAVGCCISRWPHGIACLCSQQLSKTQFTSESCGPLHIYWAWAFTWFQQLERLDAIHPPAAPSLRLFPFISLQCRLLQLSWILKAFLPTVRLSLNQCRETSGNMVHWVLCPSIGVQALQLSMFFFSKSGQFLAV